MSVICDVHVLRLLQGHDGAVVLLETSDFSLANAPTPAQGAASAPRASVVLKERTGEMFPSLFNAKIVEPSVHAKTTHFKLFRH